MLGSILLASLALVELVSGTHIPRAGARFNTNHPRNPSPVKRDLPARVDNTIATFYRLVPAEGGTKVHCNGLEPDGESEFFVAMNTQMFNVDRDCFKMITIWGEGKAPVQAQILDSCPTCPTYGHIDMSTALMRYFDPTLTKGIINIGWSTDGSSEGGSQPEPEPEPTSTTPEWTPEPTSTWTPPPTSTWTPEPTTQPPTTSEKPSPTPSPSPSSQSVAPSSMSLSASLSSSAALPSLSLNATLVANGTALNSTANITSAINGTNATSATITAAMNATATVALPHVTVAHNDVVVVADDGKGTPDSGNFAVLNGLVANFGRIILIAASA